MNIVANLISPNLGTFEREEKFEIISPDVGVNKINKPVESFDSRFVQIITYLKEIHRLKNPGGEFTLNYLVELFERDIPELNKSFLIKKINKIGFEELRDTFERINMECEDYFCESEDLFGILKRHQFSKKTLRTDFDRLRQVIQYVHITLIHVNILNKKGISSPPNLISIKNTALNRIESFVHEVEILLQNILDQNK